MIKSRTHKDHSSFYTSIFNSFIITVATTIMLISSILYFSFEEISLTLIHTFIKDNLSQSSFSAELMTETARTLALQIYFDPDISNILNSANPDISKQSTVLNRLNSYKSTTPYANSIYIYNKHTKTFYTNSTSSGMIHESVFYDSQIMDMLKNLGPDNPMKPFPRLLPEYYPNVSQIQTTGVYTILFYDTHDLSSTGTSAVVVNISEAWMLKTLKSYDTDIEGETFLMDHNGRLVSSGLADNILTDISDREYIGKILDSKQPSGFFISSVNGAKSLFTYVYSSSLDWFYVKITPYQNVVKKINDLKLKTFAIAFLILIFGLLASFVISRKVYKPINIMYQKVNTLEEEKRNSLNTLKQEFLQALIKGSMDRNYHHVREQFKAFKISLDPNKDLLIILYKYDDYSKLLSTSSAQDRKLMNFSILNIATEICSEKHPCEPVDCADDHVALLVNLDFIPEYDLYGTINRILERTIEAVAVYLKISVSAAVSLTGSTIFEAITLYTQALDTSKYTMFNTKSCILYTSNIDNVKEKEFNYPADKEKQLINAILAGNFEQAKSIYMDIINFAAGYSYNDFNSAILKIVLAINAAISSLEKNNGVSLPYNLSSFIAQINDTGNIQELNRKFYDLFQQLIQNIAENKNTKYNDLLEKLYKYIDDNFTNPNLSIEAISDILNMSPVYLGRLFKKLTSKSVSDYITEIRLEKAKLLLKTTAKSANEIAESVGLYNIPYFYTLFKKAYGMTPNDFRQG